MHGKNRKGISLDKAQNRPRFNQRQVNLAGYARKPPDVGAGLVRGAQPPPGRGEAEPLLRKSGRQQAPNPLQVIYNQWFMEIPKDRVSGRRIH